MVSPSRTQAFQAAQWPSVEAASWRPSEPLHWCRRSRNPESPASVKTLKQGQKRCLKWLGIHDFGVEKVVQTSPMTSNELFKHVQSIQNSRDCLFQKLENGGTKGNFWFPRSSQDLPNPKTSDHKRIPGIQEDRTMRRQFRAQGVYQSGRLHVIFA